MIERILLKHKDLGHPGEIITCHTVKRKIGHQLGKRPPQSFGSCQGYYHSPGQCVLICNTRFTELNPNVPLNPLPANPEDRQGSFPITPELRTSLHHIRATGCVLPYGLLQRKNLTYSWKAGYSSGVFGAPPGPTEPGSSQPTSTCPKKIPISPRSRVVPNLPSCQDEGFGGDAQRDVQNRKARVIWP